MRTDDPEVRHTGRSAARPSQPSVDETMLAENLALTPAERLARFAAAYHDVRRLAPTVRRTVD